MTKDSDIPSAVKEKYLFKMKRIEDKLLQKETNEVKTWDIHTYGKNQYNEEMRPFLAKEAKKLFEDSIQKMKKTFEKRR